MCREWRAGGLEGGDGHEMRGEGGGGGGCPVPSKSI